MDKHGVYTKGLLLKLAVLSLPAIGQGALLLMLIVSGEWNGLSFFLMFFLVNLTAIVLVIIRIKKPKLCYRNVNCCFCPFSYGNIADLDRQVSLDLPTRYQWEKWSHHTQQYTQPIIQSLSRLTHAQFSLLSSGGSGEQCAVPFDVNQRKCVGFRICYSSHDVSPLRSDHDVMLIPDVYASEFIPGQSPTSKLCILTGNGITPGFAQVVLMDTSLTAWTPYCFYQNGWYYLATDLVRGLTLMAVKNISIGVFPGSRCNSKVLGCVSGRMVTVQQAGPAVKLNIEDDRLPWWSLLLSVACCAAACPLCCAMSDSTRLVYFEADIIVSIWCPIWPTCARQWITRARHWPAMDVVSAVTKAGCHLVPKSPSPTLNTRLEWRLSFSLGEIKLAAVYPARAKTCYLLLKILLKTYLKYKCPVLKTYHVKTILLWFIERNPLEIWSRNSTAECVDLLLTELIDCAEAKRCHNYWLPEVNLFESMETSDSQVLADMLKRIKSRPDLYFANLASACCGHRVLSCFNVFIIAPMCLIMIFGVILLSSLSDPLQNNDYSNSSFPWNQTFYGNTSGDTW